MPSCVSQHIFICASQVEIFCYALSPSDGSEWRQRIQAETEHFLDVSAWSVPDIAARISADSIHVAVNLNGYTKVWMLIDWPPWVLPVRLLADYWSRDAEQRGRCSTC